MTYNLSPSAVERWRDELDLLTSGQPVRFPSENPHMLAYSLREAIAAARHHKIEPYASLGYTFRKREGVVIAEPRRSLVREKPILANSEVTLDGSTEFSVVQQMLKNKQANVATFPHFTGDTTPIKRWADANGYILSYPPLVLQREKKPVPMSKMLHRLAHQEEEIERDEDDRADSNRGAGTRRRSPQRDWRGDV